MILFISVFSLSCYITFTDNDFLSNESAVQIYNSSNKDIKILNFSLNDIGAIYINNLQNKQENCLYEFSVNQHSQKTISDSILVKNSIGEILPTNPVKTKLFYNKLFDVRGKAIISKNTDNNFSTVIKAEYILLNGESRKIELLKDERSQTFALKTLWNNICYEIDKIQAEKYFDVGKIILTPKDIFYNSDPEILNLSIFSKDFDYPVSIEKSGKESLYNGSIGEKLFVLHTKDTQQFLAKYFKGNIKVASLNTDKKSLEHFGFDSPETILDIKTDTKSSSIYFSRPKDSINYYLMLDGVPVIYETTLGKLPKKDDLNKYVYSFGDSKNLSSVVLKSQNIQYIFEIEKNNDETKYKYNSRKVPSQVFFDVFDKFYFVDVLQYTTIEENFELRDMKLAFKITIKDNQNKETFANFYTLEDEQKALMYVGEDDGYIVNNSFVEEILKQIEDLNK